MSAQGAPSEAENQTLVTERVKVVLGEVLGNPDLPAIITDDTDIIHDLGIDSIQMINFLLAIEDVFDVELAFEELSYDQVQSFHELCRFIMAAMTDSS